MLETVWNQCKSYYDDIPQDTFRSVGRSAVVSFTVTLLITSRCFGKFAQGEAVDLARPAIAAVIAATATLIHALTTPLFNAIFGDNEVKFEREILKYVCILSCTYQVLNQVSALKEQLVWLVFMRTFPPNLILAELDCLPRVVGLFNANLADEIRMGFTAFGCGVDKTSNTPCYTFAS